MKKYLITGAAGFIGSKVVEELLLKNHSVVGIDSLNNYYNPELKKQRLRNIQNSKNNNNWKFIECNIKDAVTLKKIFYDFRPEIVINLAAQAGVRYSIINPNAYIESNLVGFANILEMCRQLKIEHLLYASSSSVYGANRKMPYDENHSVNHPISLYAATKRSNELMAHSYSNLYGLKSTGLRFFTVYGPWGRPDMAPMIFAKSILSREPIKIFNDGKMKRDFTFIDDIVKAVCKCSLKYPESNDKFDYLNPEPSTSFAPHKIFNIGNSSPINLLEFIEILENALGIRAKKTFSPLQSGDVLETFANTKKLKEWINYEPTTNIKNGVKKFADWFLKTGYKY
ncbi:hypothetical protein CUB78_06645 [Prochlorococcus marinus str. XMU1401]|uniref:NAD-dependent epimerase/dehydratase family protein n=1 Tax=Prochlorococcus marinus str. XMU1401 TaxID=2052594 RepID=A0A8I2BKH4_PROMR|nr:NAD-dependent epimerase/dehydratase family protein [Prochlorococcus marinus]MBO8223281.1 NAD-dependent epimerase/dehydratase family protein [Prochlorococcus marinus str. XMU1401]MBW3059813.1 hypothetical protein [Prochlorococcus marinus str. XMU1401E]MCQ9198961.1 NAD-dependent epimerase/dehydratase family protein [Prochlorococcus marinus XMU1429]PJC83627.1 hypothetical protein CUB78_06645 [Prochlorococcus marinus str. XMU1401]